MKKIITILFFSVSIVALSQDIKPIEANTELIEKTQAFFNNYFQQIKAQNWNELMDNMPKDFLELVGKESLIKQTKQAFNNEAFTTTFNAMDYKSIASAFQHENIIYANVNYHNSFTFNFIQTEKQTDKEFNLYVDFMAETFTNKFKDQKVERNGKDITISGEKIILVIDDSKVGALKMLEFDKNMVEFYKLFLAEAVVNKLSE
ncbi:hypothetical protein [Winogradskyella sp.]|uniref:hypothetical protein n=1 Tax=Winogradskyella sp. TaxID=1883156 RepID=UPI0025D149CA|nr:hypothetical protein [Winogradskyella sp.]